MLGNGGRWGRGFWCGERRHALGEVLLAVVDGFLVAHGDVDVAVAGELHEFLGGGAADGGHGGGEVAEVVEAEVGASDLVAGPVEAVAGVLLLPSSVEAWRVAVDLSRGERPPVGTRKHQRVGIASCVGGEVLPNVLDEVGR